MTAAHACTHACMHAFRLSLQGAQGRVLGCRVLYLQEQWYRTANRDTIVQCPHPDCQFFYAIEAEDLGGGRDGDEGENGARAADDGDSSSDGDADADAGAGAAPPCPESAAPACVGHESGGVTGSIHVYPCVSMCIRRRFEAEQRGGVQGNHATVSPCTVCVQDSTRPPWTAMGPATPRRTAKGDSTSPFVAAWIACAVHLSQVRPVTNGTSQPPRRVRQHEHADAASRGTSGRCGAGDVGKRQRWHEGRDMWCDTCEMRYCLHCGDAMGTLVRWHAGKTCTEFLQEADNAKSAAERQRLEREANAGCAPPPRPSVLSAERLLCASASFPGLCLGHCHHCSSTRNVSVFIQSCEQWPCRCMRRGPLATVCGRGLRPRTCPAPLRQLHWSRADGGGRVCRHEQNRGKTWQRCPKCGYEAWKADGQCNRVVCKEHCGTNFCFLCGEDITQIRYKHYEIANHPCHYKVWHHPLAGTEGSPACRCASCRRA